MTTIDKPLPAGWKWERLGDVCETKTGIRDPGKQPDDEFVYVDISSVDNQTKRIVEPKTLLGCDAPSRARQVICARDVIVSTTRPNLNAVALIPDELDDEICSTGFCVLRATNKIDADYLFAYVQSEWFVQSLSDLVKGALYPAVTDGQVRAQLIPLPSLNEQKRIATILTEQLTAVDHARVAAEAQIGLSLQLIEAYLRQSLATPVCHLPLRDCLTEVSKGVGIQWNRYPLLGVSRAGIAPAKEAMGKQAERYKLADAETIFYNPMRILLGSIALVDTDDEPGLASPDYVVLKTRQGILHHRWLYYWLRSSYGETFIKTLAKGAVRERMMFTRLAQASIDVPAWHVQMEVAEKLKSVLAMRHAVNAQLDTINQLPATLLQQAFTGNV